jgi:hypothetical protein
MSPHVSAMHRPHGRVLRVIPDEVWEAQPEHYAHLPGPGQALWHDVMLCCTFVCEPVAVEPGEEHGP